MVMVFMVLVGGGDGLDGFCGGVGGDGLYGFGGGGDDLSTPLVLWLRLIYLCHTK